MPVRASPLPTRSADGVVGGLVREALSPKRGGVVVVFLASLGRVISRCPCGCLSGSLLRARARGCVLDCAVRLGIVERAQVAPALVSAGVVVAAELQPAAAALDHIGVA